MTKIKICGLRTGEEAIAARDMGADFLGFIFVSGAKRCLEASFAKSEMVLADSVWVISDKSSIDIDTNYIGVNDFQIHHVLKASRQ